MSVVILSAEYLAGSHAPSRLPPTSARIYTQVGRRGKKSCASLHGILQEALVISAVCADSQGCFPFS